MSSYNTFWQGLIDGVALFKWAVIGGVGFYVLAVMATLIFAASALFRLFRRLFSSVNITTNHDRK